MAPHSLGSLPHFTTLGRFQLLTLELSCVYGDGDSLLDNSLILFLEASESCFHSSVVTLSIPTSYSRSSTLDREEGKENEAMPCGCSVRMFRSASNQMNSMWVCSYIKVIISVGKMRRKLFLYVDANEYRTKLQIVNHGSPHSCWGHTVISGAFGEKVKSPLPTTCFLFSYRTVSVLSFVPRNLQETWQCFPKPYPTTNPRETAGTKGTERIFFTEAG